MLPYTIAKSAQHRLIDITLVGLWNMAVVDAHRRDVADAMQSLGGTGGLRILIDATEHGLQPKDVAEAITSMVADFAALDNVSAVVVPQSALTGLQSKRMGSSLSRNRYFSSRGDALSWLLDQDVSKVA